MLKFIKILLIFQKLRINFQVSTTLKFIKLFILTLITKNLLLIIPAKSQYDNY